MPTITIFWVIGSFALLIIGSWMMTSMHEQAHVEICKKFNGEVLSISVLPWEGSVVCNATMSESFNLAHSQVEAFGYQLHAAVIVMILFMMFGGALYFMNDEIKQDRMERIAFLNEIRYAIEN